MKKNISIVFCFLLLSEIIIAQQSKIDSLKYHLKISKNDTDRINNLNSLADLLAANNTDTAIKLNNEALIISEKIGWQYGKARTYQYLGRANLVIGHYSTAIQYLQKALELWDQLIVSGSYKNGENAILRNKVSTLCTMGRIYEWIADNPQALNCYTNALNIAESQKDSAKVATILFDFLASVYMTQGDYKQAIIYYNRALEISEVLGNLLQIENFHCGISNIYLQRGDYEMALKHLNRALIISKQLNDSNRIAAALGFIGGIYKDQGELLNSSPEKKIIFFENALDNYSKALTISEILANKYGAALWLGNIAEVFKLQGNYHKALEYYTKTLNAYEKLSNENGKALWTGKIGSLYAAMVTGENYANEMPFRIKAESFLLKALKMSDSIGVLDYKYDNLLELSSLYTKTGNYRKALDYYKNAMVTKDSIFNALKSKQIAEINTKYETAKKDDEITLLNRERVIKNQKINEQSRNMIMISAFAGVAILGVVVVLLAYRQRKIRFDFKTQQMDNKFLRFQLKPHFIKNALLAIRKYIRLHPEIAEEYFDKYSYLMRQILVNSEKEKISLDEEMSMLTKYMDLESLRLTHGFNYSINIDPDIDGESLMVPPLILQPIIENAIWHGIADKNEKGEISIDISRGDNILKCVIENYCSGSQIIEIENEKHGTSFGLKITRERLQLLAQEKKRKWYLVENPELNGMKVQLGIPL